MKHLGRPGYCRLTLSPPARGRGLKPRDLGCGLGDYVSPPARGRGLKHLKPWPERLS